MEFPVFMPGILPSYLLAAIFCLGLQTNLLIAQKGAFKK